MPAQKRSDSPPRRRPATTPEARERQMIGLADRLAEKRLREGTATAQEILHYVRLGSSREELEQTKIKYENLLREAQIEQIQGQERLEDLYKNALAAMSEYQGRDPVVE